MDVFFDKICLILTYISGIHISVIPHFVCRMDAFSTWCSAHVDDMVTFFRTCSFRYKHRAYILHQDLSLKEGLKCQNMIVIGNLQCIGKIRSLFYCHSLRLQTGDDLSQRRLMSTAPYCDRSFCQKILQDLLRSLHSVGCFPFFYQIFRHGIFHRKITDFVFFPGRKLQITDLSCDRTEHPVDKGL